MVEVIQSGVLARIRVVADGTARQFRLGLWVTKSWGGMSIVFPTRHSGGRRSKARGWAKLRWFPSDCVLAASTREQFQLLQDIVEIGPPAEIGGPAGKRKTVNITWEALVATINRQRPELLYVGDRSVAANSYQPISAREQLVVEALCRRAYDAAEPNVYATTPDRQSPDGAYSAYRPTGSNAIDFLGPAACAAAHAFCVGIDFGDGILSPEAPPDASPRPKKKGGRP